MARSLIYSLFGYPWTTYSLHFKQFSLSYEPRWELSRVTISIDFFGHRISLRIDKDYGIDLLGY